MAYTRPYHDVRVVSSTYIDETGVTTTGDQIIDLNGTRSGEKGHDWKMKVRNGLQAGTPYTSDRAKVVRSEPGSFQIKFRSASNPAGVIRSQTGSGYFLPITSCVHHVASSTSVENAALSKIHKRIREQTSHMNGQSFLGELGDTIRMLKRPMSTLRDKVNEHLSLLDKRKKGVRGRNPREKRKAWKDVVSSTWLETQFGIIPLISDTKDIAESIARFQTKPPRRTVLTAREVQSIVTTQQSSNILTSGSYLVAKQVTRKRTDVSCQYRVGMETSVMADFSSTTRLRETLGFTLENFVPALWEVLPWSWLADYFSNAGAILEAMTTDTSNVRWIVMTVKRKTEHERNLMGDIPATNDYLGAFGFVLVQPSVDGIGSITLARTTVDRIIVPSLGVPSLEFSIPGVDSTRWLNLAAVWGQRRKSVESVRF